MDKLKVIIADDHPVIRNGAIEMIKDMKLWHTEFREANNFKELIAALQEESFDLILLDINMPHANGINMIEDIRNIQKHIKILVFSSYDESTYAFRYLKAEANGYLQKDINEKEFKAAVQAVVEKGKYASKNVIDIVLFSQNNEMNMSSKPFEELSNRELDVCIHLVNGMGTLEISNNLNLKTSTISTYKKRIFEKLNVKNIAELIKMYQTHYEN